MHNEETMGGKIQYLLGRAQYACLVEMAHAQLRAGWGWVLQAGASSTELPYK